MNKNNLIVAVGGGKGGVGKTVFASLLALKYAEEKKKVILIDADLGGSNIHTIMGINPAYQRGTITTYFRSKGALLDEILIDCGVKHIKVACGSLHNYKLVNLPHFLKLRFFNELRKKDSDIIILDLGSGSAYTTLDFFAFSDIGIVVTTVEKTSIENAYRFLKGSFLRKLRFEVMKYGSEIIDEVLNTKEKGSPLKPYQIIEMVVKLHPEIADKIDNFLRNTKIGIVLNMIENSQDILLGKKMEMAVKTYLDVDVKFLGGLFSHPELKKTIRMGEPITRAWECSNVKNNFNKIYTEFKAYFQS